jgi:hypothetical protein
MRSARKWDRLHPPHGSGVSGRTRTRLAISQRHHEVDAREGRHQAGIAAEKSAQGRSGQERDQQRQGYDQMTGTGKKARHRQGNATNATHTTRSFLSICNR